MNARCFGFIYYSFETLSRGNNNITHKEAAKTYYQ